MSADEQREILIRDQAQARAERLGLGFDVALEQLRAEEAGRRERHAN